MSGEQFLRAHGWRARAAGWEHPHYPDVIFGADVAYLQQAQWLAAALHDIRHVVETYGDDVPEKAIHLIKLHVKGVP